MRRAWRVALAVLVVTLYFLAAPFGYAAFTVWQRWPARDPVVRARRLQGIMRRAFTLMHDTLRWLGLLDFNPRRIEGTIPAGPCVLVGNHPSLCDVTSTMAAIPDVTTVIKPALYKKSWARPLLEGAMQFEGALGTVGLSQVIQAGLDRLAKGFRVLIFPEGTRSPAGGLHPFGRTAFEIACRAGVPVVPIVYDWDPVWLSKEVPILAVPKRTPRLVLRALPPVHPRDHGFSSRAVRDVVDGLIRNQLGLRRAGHEAEENAADANAAGRAAAEGADRGVLGPGGCEARGH